MSLHDLIQADASNVFANNNDFAETIAYYKRGGFCEAREIDAVVIRDPISVFPEDGDTVSPVFQVYLVNDETTGVSSDEINTGGDELEFSPRVGKAIKRHSIVRILEHDEGMVLVECR